MPPISPPSPPAPRHLLNIYYLGHLLPLLLASIVITNHEAVYGRAYRERVRDNTATSVPDRLLLPYLYGSSSPLPPALPPSVSALVRSSSVRLALWVVVVAAWVGYYQACGEGMGIRWGGDGASGTADGW
mmetsp:Transcript_30759/g.60992  ORF Transcript_30759/g.60992 Transcript_30759/m.60992 type:complete len:130 (-) Transcript_30759:109-498(-)